MAKIVEYQGEVTVATVKIRRDKLEAIEWSGLTRSGHIFCVACGNVYETNMGKHLRSCWLKRALNSKEPK